jgi:hypothetical protein
MKTKTACLTRIIQCITFLSSISGFLSTAFAQPGVLADNKSASVVLNYDNFIVAPNVSFARQGANAQGVKIPATGNNQTWDYTELSGNDLYSASITYAAANSSFFSAARRKISFVFPLGESFLVQETGFESDDITAYQRLGRSIDRQAFSIGELSGFPTDSLIITQQDVLDEGLLSFVAYPCKTSSSWSTSARASTAFQLSFVAFGLDHTPGEFIQRQTLTRTVVGSGKMRIPFGNEKSKFINVLMVKSVLTTIDSVYLGGAPAPPEIIAAFGLTQGEELDDYGYFFIRAGIDEPLISFNMNEDFSAINFIQYDTKFADIYCGKDKELICDGNGEIECVPYASVTDMLLGNSEATIGACADNKFVNSQQLKNGQLPGNKNSIKLTAYPNPSSDVFRLKLNNADNSNTLIRVSDLSGRLIIQFNTREQEINFGRELKPGIYFAEILRENTKALIRLVKL